MASLLIWECACGQVRAARGLPDDLVRISAGVEDVDDLLEGARLWWRMTIDTYGSK